MTKNEMILELAKMDGWTNLKLGVYGAGAPEREPSPHGTPPTRKTGMFSCPDYFGSYDAILPLVKKQEIYIKEKMKEVYGITALQTPERIALVLLEVKGAYVPEKPQTWQEKFIQAFSQPVERTPRK